RHRSLAGEVVFAKDWMHGFDHAPVAGERLESGPVGVAAPRPFVPKPKRRQYMQFSRVRAAVVDADLNEDVFGGFLGVFDENIEVAIVIEDTAVEQIILKFGAAAAAVGFHQIVVWEGH